jgi:hypothetical protein
MAPLIALVMGLLWMVGGYFFFKDLYFVGISAFNGEKASIPVWRGGFVILAIGIGMWWKARNP